jgi:hypothetical protein
MTPPFFFFATGLEKENVMIFTLPHFCLDGCLDSRLKKSLVTKTCSCPFDIVLTHIKFMTTKKKQLEALLELTAL